MPSFALILSLAAALAVIAAETSAAPLTLSVCYAGEAAAAQEARENRWSDCHTHNNSFVSLLSGLGVLLVLFGGQ